MQLIQVELPNLQTSFDYEPVPPQRIHIVSREYTQAPAKRISQDYLPKAFHTQLENGFGSKKINEESLENLKDLNMLDEMASKCPTWYQYRILSNNRKRYKMRKPESQQVSLKTISHYLWRIMTYKFKTPNKEQAQSSISLCLFQNKGCTQIRKSQT